MAIALRFAAVLYLIESRSYPADRKGVGDEVMGGTNGWSP